MHVIHVRNVNDALYEFRLNMEGFYRMNSGKAYGHHEVINRTARGKHTLEIDGPVSTVYERPYERVLFSHARDCNPFFHLFETLWIMAGRDDVAFLSLFNSNMKEYSDDGLSFHAPYGYRLRRHFRQKNEPLDQLLTVCKMLAEDPETRRAVLTIWNPKDDLNKESKDIPCNDMVFLKLREGALDMTVCCRSNDALWGAYGTNVVQFSVIQEFIACAVGVKMGELTQVSDSLHLYPDNPAWPRLLKEPRIPDPYREKKVISHPLISTVSHEDWLAQCELLCETIMSGGSFLELTGFDRFFEKVAMPLYTSWFMYKQEHNLNRAIEYLMEQATQIDWIEAGLRWLLRRKVV